MTSETKTRIRNALQHAARTARASDDAAEALACDVLLAGESVTDDPPAPPAADSHENPSDHEPVTSEAVEAAIGHLTGTEE